jgi:hypothetical protein
MRTGISVVKVKCSGISILIRGIAAPALNPFCQSIKKALGLVEPCEVEKLHGGDGLVAWPVPADRKKGLSNSASKAPFLQRMQVKGATGRSAPAGHP